MSEQMKPCPFCGHAHPMNIHRVALDALEDAKLAPSDALLTLQTEDWS